MQYMLTPYHKKTEPFAWWEGAFNEQELNWLQQKAREASQQAVVGNGPISGYFPEVRRSEINWLACNNETQWVFEKLAHVVSSLNSQFFFFDLTGFGEHIQLTHYDEKYQGMYGWHVDFGSNPTSPSRKLSLVMQLSDPVDYEGGVLELQPSGKEIVKMRKQRGLIVCFPSWTLHQVTPVTQGNRQSLVSWISGPSFI
jgi:PKHD-type hydroxylase